MKSILENQFTQPQVCLSVILPVYNEADNLRVILPKLCETLSSLDVSHEVIVVDAFHSTDDAEAVCNWPFVRYFKTQKGERYGGAIRLGIQTAQGEHSIIMDADGSHNPNFIPELYAFKNQYDVVIASRYIHGGVSANPALLVLLSKLINRMFYKLIGANVRDASNSFKLYRSEQLKKLTLTSKHFDIGQEILFKLRRSFPGISIKELPFTFDKRLYGHSKRQYISFTIAYITTLLKLHFSRK